MCSGDSTVPVYSATFPIGRWPNVKSTEVLKCDHNELLRDVGVINTILSYAIDDFEPTSSKKLIFKPDQTNGARIFDGPYLRKPAKFEKLNKFEKKFLETFKNNGN